MALNSLRGRYARRGSLRSLPPRAVGQEGDEGRGRRISGKRARRKRHCAGAETQYDDDTAVDAPADTPST